MIPRAMWNRLNNTAKPLSQRHIQHLLIVLAEGETREDLDRKIERWKAGEKVDGISAEYEGGDVEIGRPFAFVSPEKVEL